MRFSLWPKSPLGNSLGAKLDTEKAGRNRKADLEQVRERWAQLANAAMEQAGVDARIDHRSHADAGIDTIPTRHLGPKATAVERRKPGSSRLRLTHRQAHVGIRKFVRRKEKEEQGGLAHAVNRAEELLLGNKARGKVQTASNGVYQGTIVDETPTHWIQRLSPKLMVVHDKANVSGVVLGQNGTLRYVSGRAAMVPVKRQELDRGR